MDTEIPGGTSAGTPINAPVVIPAIDMTTAQRHPAKNTRPNLLAAGLAIVLAIGGGVALLADDQASTITAASSKLPKLKLAAPGTQEARSAGASMMPYFDYKYSHTGAWPVLNSTAPVYKLVGHAIDPAEAARLAAVLGVDGTAIPNDKGWLITDGDREVSITPGDGGFSVALYSNTGLSVMSSSGSGTAGVNPGAAPDAKPDVADPDRPVEQTPPTTVPDPVGDRTPDLIPVPKNLPSESEAIKIAQRAMDALNIDAAFEYEAMNAATATVGGSCGPAVDCAVDTTTSTVYTRSVLAHQLVDGQRVSGLSWSFEIGDNGVLQSAYGTIATLEKLGDYPLRSIQSVYDDIVAGTFYQGQPMPMAAAVAETTLLPEPSSSTPGSNDTSVSPPSPGTIDPTCLAKECAMPEPGIVPPDSTIAPVTSTVNLTGVQISSQVWYGFDGTNTTTYIVPIYSFSGTVTSPDNPGSPWTSQYIALDQSFIDATTPPIPTGDDTKVTIEPQPPVVVPGTDQVEPIEPVQPVEP